MFKYTPLESVQYHHAALGTASHAFEPEKALRVTWA